MIKRNIIITISAGLILLGPLLATESVNAQPATSCGGVDTAIIDCADNNDAGQAIFSIIKIVIQILTGLIGVVAVGAVIYGAILYGASGATPENVKKAKDMWTNVVIGLLLFAFLITITNFLIPGGVF